MKTLREIRQRDTFTAGRPDSKKSRSLNSGDGLSSDKMIKFHKKQIKELGKNGFKSHVRYHEDQIRKLNRVSEAKEKSKKKSTKRAVRSWSTQKGQHAMKRQWDDETNDATRDSMRAGRRNYGQGKGK